MELTTAQKAMIAMLKLQERALERGATVSLPITDSCRNDAIIEEQGRLYRAQIKYGDRKGASASGAIGLELTSYHRSGKLSYAGYTEKEIDALLVYIPRIDKVLWFGPEVFAGRSQIQIRYEPTKNGQTKGCLFAADYVW